MSDQHNPHVLGSSGDTLVRTPNLDHLARGGVRFGNNYCNHPLCVPSRMSFLTGRHCHELDIRSNGDFLRAEVPTFAHGLGRAGYETVLCGRMHIVGPDQNHGFSKRLVGDLNNDFGGHDPAITGDLPIQTAYDTEVACRLAGPGRTTYQMYDEAVTASAVEFLGARSGEDATAPFCLVVGYVLPHCPFSCPEELFSYYRDKVTLPELPGDYFEQLHPAVRLYRDRGKMDVPSSDEMLNARAAYYGMVDLMDQNIGRVLAALDAAGLRDDTVVVYTSDHGEMAGEHRMWMKTCFYEGSAAVPLIVSSPDGIAREEPVRQVTSLVDVAPTLLDLAGAEPLPEVPGSSLARFLQAEGQADDWPDTAFVECSAPVYSRMIRSGPWKLNVYPGYDRPQLFNLDEDPEEFNDRAGDPACSGIVEELTHRVFADWSPEECTRRHARKAEMSHYLRKWAERTGRDLEHRWPGVGSSLG